MVTGTQMRPLSDYELGIQPLIPTIIYLIGQSPINEAEISLGDVISITEQKLEDIRKDTLESIICGLSSALYQQKITTSTKIVFETIHQIHLIFRPSTPKDTPPTLDTCDENWNKLIELPTKEKEDRYKSAIQRLIPQIKEGIITIEKTGKKESIYYTSFILGAMGREFLHDNIISVLCGISPELFNNGIYADIKIIDPGWIVYSFRDITPQDKRPIIDNCIEKWIRLFVEQ